MKNSKGFTLIELMVVIAVIAILASLALPAYQSQMKSTRRATGQAALMGFAQAMERQYTEEGTYAKADGDDADESGVSVAPIPSVFASQAPLSGNEKFYDLRIIDADNSGYLLRAIAINGQVGDGPIELSSTGAKRWDRDDDGFDGSDNCWEKSC